MSKVSADEKILKGKIAVLCGGDGAEREVSLRSGEAVCRALREAGCETEAVDLRSLEEVSGLGGFALAFVAMHGDWGEDGRLQARLEEAGIPYTGSGPGACALAMNKWRARAAFERAGLSVPRGILVPSGEADPDEVRAELGDTVVVKPCSGGSTVGVTLFRDPAEMTPEALHNAVALARKRYDSEVLIERYVEGRELTATAWEQEDGRVAALPVIEIVPRHGFYDYGNKYTAGATEYLVPAPLDADVLHQVELDAVEAHRALGCRAYSRTDFRLSRDGVPYVLETNTAPGRTATSLVPKAAAAAGIPFPEFVLKIVRAALPS